MSEPYRPLRADAAPSREIARGSWLLGVVLIAAVIAAYHNSFSVPFVFDDESSIVHNPSIRQLWPLPVPLQPPADRGQTVGGRPLLNFTFALNYAMSGTGDVRSYHVVNVLIHGAAALVLLGLVRRTLIYRNQQMRAAPDGSPTWLALAIAALWALHPLQTESVTYVVQRAESLVGLLYFATLYCFARGAHASGRMAWTVAAVALCFLGMTAKEVMATAPLVIFLYDRAFLGGSFRAAWRQRWRTHMAFAAAWVVLAWLVARSGGRGDSAGFGIGVSSWEYALTQCQAVMHYLRLSFWPFPLLIDYGRNLIRNLGDVWPQLAILGLLLASTVVALRRAPAAGFLGASFFCILAPTSSVIPVADPIFEHRMYLPLAALIALAVCSAHAVFGKKIWVGCAVAAAAFGWLTERRNHDYRSEIALWTDAVAKLPSNPRAHTNLGTQLVAAGRLDDAIAHYREAARLAPADSVAAHNLGNALDLAKRREEAIPWYERALQLDPANLNARIALANALAMSRRLDDAWAHYEEAARRSPESAVVHAGYARSLLRAGQTLRAIAHYAEAARLDPTSADAHFNYGSALAQARRLPEAIDAFRAAVRITPAHVEGWNNLGNALLFTGQPGEAIECYREALRLKPSDRMIKTNLDRALVMQQRGSAPRP